MEFDSFDMDTIMMRLMDDNDAALRSDQQSESDSHSSTLTEQSEALGMNEQQQQQSTPAQHDKDGQYCLIVFNNPKWSQLLRKQKERTQQQQQPHTQNVTQQSATTTTVKQETKELSLDDQFIIQLRFLIKHYMEHTKRPFPVKYFINLTDE